MKNEKSIFWELLKKIPEKDIENVAFYLVIAILGSHVLEIFAIGFFKKSIYYEVFELIGTLCVMFIIVWLCAFFVKNGKDAMAVLKEMKVWDGALVVMLMWSVISSLLADDYDTAFLGTVYRNEGMLTYFKYAAFYICAIIIKNRKKRKLIVQAMTGMITIMSAVSVVQCVTKQTCGFEMYASTLHNTNHFAYLLSMGILLAAGMYMVEQNKIWKVSIMLAYGLNVWALIINKTMGGYVAVCFGMLFLGAIILHKDKKRKKDVVMLLLCFVVVNVGTNLSNGILTENFIESAYGITEDGLTDAAGSGRIGLWKQAIVYIGEKPVFGFGPEGLNQPYAEDGFTNVRPHNEYLQHMAYLGIPGGLLYLIALGSLFWECMKNLKKQSFLVLILGGAIFAYCVSAFFGNTFYYTAVYYFILLGMLSVSSKEIIDE